MNTIYKAKILSPISKDEISFFSPGYLVNSENGRILELTDENPQKKYKNSQFLDFSDKIICPGFIDVHSHLSQFQLMGIFHEKLLNWLERLVFPQEEKFQSEKYAKLAADIFFENLLSNGTTTSCTYVTVHKNATDLAFQSANEKGIRAFIGKVLVDQNVPKNWLENPEKSLKDSEGLIKKWDGIDGRLKFVLTPRHAVSCSFDFLKKIGKLAKKYDAFVQSHLSESKIEIKKIKKIFPNFKNYTDIYLKAEILSEKTIMAHCIHLSENEIKILRKTNTKISHCPTSNRFLESGIMPYRKLEESDLTIGLGTDIAGGYSTSMFNEMREAIETSKMMNIIHPEKKYRRISVFEAFYLATLGGAKVLSLENEIGSLEKNKSADFLIINLDKISGNNEEILSNPKNILSKMIYLGNENIVEQVFVKGKRLI
ncbi:MAG: guanine deaminase [Candidatus Cloacimonetes bacterium]|nr:guanine deaminase [Candidatus Cloacimonadota bacterium]